MAHDTKMTIPISNALNIKQKISVNEYKKNIYHINNLKFSFPNKKKFPLLSIIDLMPEKSSYFETSFNYIKRYTC